MGGGVYGFTWRRKYNKGICVGRKRSLYAKAITFLIHGPADTLHRGETKRGQRGNKYEEKEKNPPPQLALKSGIRRIIAATIRSS